MGTTGKNNAILDNHVRISVDNLPPRPQTASLEELEQVFGGYWGSWRLRLFGHTVFSGPSSQELGIKNASRNVKAAGMAYYQTGRTAYKKARSIIRGW